MNLNDKQKNDIKFTGICCNILLVFIGAALLGVKLRQTQYQPMEVRPPEVVPERFSNIEYSEIPSIYEVEQIPEVPIIRTSEFVNLTFEEMDLLQQIAMAEARGEDEIGQALVMLTVLNRSELSGLSIKEVIYAPGQYTTVLSDKFGHYIPNENNSKALAMILDGWDETDFDSKWDTNEKVYYFCADGYPIYGNIGFKYEGHYFNTRSAE